MGSFYSKDEMPQYCYSIYSLWGEPDKKRELIPKGSIMKLNFKLNASLRPEPKPEGKKEPVYIPKHNLPTTPSVQMSIHSPYFLPSPYADGLNYIGGRAYELRITMREKHLLPSPYQTNCTDYTKLWRMRGGKAPIDQLGIIQECRMNKTEESRGCIPMDLDYPHQYTICKQCSSNCSDELSTHECLSLADSFTQPCDSIFYTTFREDKSISIYQEINTAFLRQKEGTRVKIKEHDCTGNKVWRPECGEIYVEVLFDRFEISNLTYKPKFESLEIFSVIGGYMGMWLGISLMAVYDLIETIVTLLKARVAKRKKMKKNLYNDKHDKLFSKTNKPIYW